MKLREATILEIDSLENPQPFKGTNLDYIIVKKELKEEFLESEFRVAVLPMLKTGGKVLYA